ncbi:hypothetical protein DJ73_18990 [Halorubrum sp. Ea1]|uniref:hypothetical protein n=1 Tax=Halorubrum sp. Ea1 TaxID=1480718 RepID=UPI000B9867C8|nr:hypothetical protein [Halorubrum sp. Ea1]OYR48770.1 hypothetical protein DJ73_18990 [Halorubrum sp. Ea1]
MTLEQLLDRYDDVERSIVVVNRTDPDPVLNMLTDTFGDAVQVADRSLAGDGGTGSDRTETRSDHPGARSDGPADASGAGLSAERLTMRSPDADKRPVIDVDALRRNDAVPFDGDDPGGVENLALLVEGDEVVAGSTLGELGDAVLFVNSDLYVTGSRTLEDVDLPSVISGLEDTTFTLRGYPESNRQKLLLITISRFIERAAWVAGDGTLRSSFQRLSRIEDEVGTREVYESVVDAGVDTHLYGVPDDLPRGLDAVVHGGDSRDFTHSWFVVYRPPGGPTSVDGGAGSDLDRGMDGGVGLLAVEAEPRVWRGMWTFDEGRVRAMNRYIERNL